MLLDTLDILARRRSPIHRLSASSKALLGAGSIAVVLTPHSYWPATLAGHLTILLIVYALARLPWRFFFRRWLGFVPVVCLMAVGVPLTRGWVDGAPLAGRVAGCALVAYTSILLLVTTTPVTELLGLLNRWRAPAALSAVLIITFRYLFVLEQERCRMDRARQARTFRKRRSDYWLTSQRLIGVLFGRSLARAERVHQAMLARGWKGTMPASSRRAT